MVIAIFRKERSGPIGARDVAVCNTCISHKTGRRQKDIVAVFLAGDYITIDTVEGGPTPIAFRYKFVNMGDCGNAPSLSPSYMSGIVFRI